jgi:hypothetical protein
VHLINDMLTDLLRYCTYPEISALEAGVRLVNDEQPVHCRPKRKYTRNSSINIDTSMSVTSNVYVGIRTNAYWTEGLYI